MNNEVRIAVVIATAIVILILTVTALRIIVDNNATKIALAGCVVE